ncbi:MAG: hypothetical protein ABR591_15765 [Candidatus Velthaea sp.]
MNFVDRPSFFEGQVLSASELELVVDYARNALETHDAVAHTWGVVDGLQLQTQPAGARDGTPVALVVSPGLAVDQLGRQIEIVTQITLPHDNVSGLPTNTYPAYLWMTDDRLVPAAANDPCQTGVERVREMVHAGVFADDPTAQAQAPNAVPLGNVKWDAAQQSFVAFTDADPRHDVRRRGGVRANEIVAPERRVTVHAEDTGATTLRVQGSLQAVAAGDGTLPVIQVPGGSGQFTPAIAPGSSAPPAANTIALSYLTNAATGNELVVDLGNSDPNSQVVIEKHGTGGPGSGTPVATISATGNGTLTVANGAFTAVDATANVVVGSGANTLSLEAVPPAGTIGVSAPKSLPLAFGANAGDAAVFLAGASPAATITAHTITANEKSVALGTLDANAGTAGVAAVAGDRLVLGSTSNDVDIAPAMATLLRFTAAKTVLNMAAGACDVTPVTDVGGTHFLFRLGPIAVAYGMAALTLHPIADAPPAIVFSQAFATVPAFFVNAYAAGHFTVSASPTGVSATGATYKVVRLDPLNPGDGDGTSFSNANTNVRVSWVALGVMG